LIIRTVSASISAPRAAPRAAPRVLAAAHRLDHAVLAGDLLGAGVEQHVFVAVGPAVAPALEQVPEADADLAAASLVAGKNAALEAENPLLLDRLPETCSNPALTGT